MAGGTTYEDATGLERLNLVNKNFKDDKGGTILSLTRPELTAVPPTLGEFIGDIAGGAGDMLGAVGQKVMSGGVTGDLLNFIKDKYEGSKQKLNRFLNPPGEKVNENLEGILQNIDASNNPLFNQQVFDPIRVSDMDPSTMMAEATGVENIFNKINQLRNFGTEMGLDRFKFDPLNPNKGVDFEDTFMFNDNPVDYNIGIDPTGTFRFGLGFNY